MKDKMVAYWHNDGLEVYRIADEKPVKFASGALDKLEPIKGGLGKKILIVSRELLLHARKRYPPATEEKLFKAVALEIGDMFPLSAQPFTAGSFSPSTRTLLSIYGHGKVSSITGLRRFFLSTTSYRRILRSPLPILR